MQRRRGSRGAERKPQITQISTDFFCVFYKFLCPLWFFYPAHKATTQRRNAPTPQRRNAPTTQQPNDSTTQRPNPSVPQSLNPSLSVFSINFCVFCGPPAAVEATSRWWGRRRSGDTKRRNRVTSESKKSPKFLNFGDFFRALKQSA